MHLNPQPKQPRDLSKAYLARVRMLPCCAPGRDHMGETQAHHATGAGLALKSRDTDTMPLCARHHDDFHTASGVFNGWTKERRRSWQREMIANTRATLLPPVRKVF